MRLSTRNVSQIHDKKDRFFQIFYFCDITCLYIWDICDFLPQRKERKLY